MARYLGIDPGLRGAAAVIETGPRRISLLAAFDFQTFTPSGTDAQNRIDAQKLIAAIVQWMPFDGATIELVGAMPSIPDKDGKRRDMGTASVFKFGRAVGAIEACVMGCGIRPLWVMPGVWKRHFGISADKAVSRALAIQYFGEPHFARVKDGNRAEAALIARYHVEKLGLFGRVG